MAAGQQQRRQQQAHQGAGGGHQQRAHGGGTLPFNAGHTAKQEQGDAADLNPLAEGDEGMAQLMQQHRGEQQQSRQEPKSPEQRRRGLSGELLGELLLKGHRGQPQDHEPAGMNPQGDAADLQQLPAFTHASGPVDSDPRKD